MSAENGASQILSSVVTVIGLPASILLPVPNGEAERDHIFLAEPRGSRGTEGGIILGLEQTVKKIAARVFGPPASNSPLPTSRARNQQVDGSIRYSLTAVVSLSGRAAALHGRHSGS